MRNLRGFTLIELAIVLVIIGLLVGLGAGMIGLLVKRAKYSETRERLEANVEALIGYALTKQGKLPSSSNCSQHLRSAKDAWGKDFICITANETTQHSVCAILSTSLQVTDDNDAQTHNNTAFVIISGGPNYNVQTSNSSPIHVYLPGAKSIDDYPVDIDRKEPYDDLVRYVSLNELKAKLKCEYSEDRLRILNNELPYGFEDEDYDARVYAAGGVPYSGGEYKWCVKEEETPRISEIGIKFLCNGNEDDALSSSSDCDNGGFWKQCKFLKISGEPDNSGTFKIVFYVQDKNDNKIYKTLSVTIHPSNDDNNDDDDDDDDDD